MQKADLVAEKNAIWHGEKENKSHPSRLFRLALVVFRILPFVKATYLNTELKNFEAYKQKRIDW